MLWLHRSRGPGEAADQLHVQAVGGEEEGCVCWALEIQLLECPRRREYGKVNIFKTQI